MICFCKKIAFLVVGMSVAVAACKTRLSTKTMQNKAVQQFNTLETEGWAAVPQILKRISLPTIPNQVFKLRDLTEGQDIQQAVQKLIDDCTAKGGGKVIIPKGNWTVSGSIFMKSNVHLYFEEGAKLTFSSLPSDYLPLVRVRWEGTICYNYSPLIYAMEQKNIAITGKGILDGNTEGGFSAWKKPQEAAKKILRQMGNDKTPDSTRRFGEGYFLRPCFIEFQNCSTILLDGFTIKSSPFWTIHPVFSKKMTIRNLKIEKGTTNDDGIDPDSCEDILIENCTINTNDDPIALKAGRDQDAWERGSCRNIVVRNCQVSSEVGNAFCIGSEMSGGVENIFVEKYTVSVTDHAINFKSNLDRGGFIRNVWLRDFKIDSCKRMGIWFQKDYHSYRGGNYPPQYSGFHLENIQIQNVGETAIKIAGVAAQSVKNVSFKDVLVKKSKIGREIKFTENISMNNVVISDTLIHK
jgi:polygalacturonase